MSRLFHSSLFLIGVLLLSGCDGKEAQRPIEAAAADTNRQVFTVKGILKEVKRNGKTAIIKHEEIPNYMPAMTMPLDVKDTNQLRGLNPGDEISFKLIATEDDAWIEEVVKLNIPTPSPTELPTRRTVSIVRDVEPLEIGDPTPAYQFTNQFGKAVTLEQFRGQAVALTLIFTTCPLPTFCPRMSQNFADVQSKMKGASGAPTNWHLVSLTIDPEKDTPEVLKAYAERYNYDPTHWSFLTGDIIDVTALSEQLGGMFWREGELLNHNLRTAVFDTQGRLQKIVMGNEWKSDELVEEISKAASIK
jgi:protein SCO1/2